MLLWFALGGVLVAAGVLWYVVAHEPGPSPVDVALGYELAWDRLDFSSLFDLSGEELRDGMSRDRYVATMRSAHSSRGKRADRVAVESSGTSGDTAHVVTVLHSEGSALRNDVVLRRRGGRWMVTAYAIRPETAEL